MAGDKGGAIDWFDEEGNWCDDAGVRGGTIGWFDDAGVRGGAIGNEVWKHR